jgi:hypothetical protein
MCGEESLPAGAFAAGLLKQAGQWFALKMASFDPWGWDQKIQRSVCVSTT